ncbi:MAG: molybdate ABC transporter substrate-binding protein [Desulfovibrio sp.]|jgi:molybdate transport system substrate-binding protein|nr:molybdate ABC transporter substrate-binding protein [Desulfovibrio sp.]
MLKKQFVACVRTLSVLSLGFVLSFIFAPVQKAEAAAAEMTISGAASLTDAFTELKTMFEKAHPGLTANVNFAASNPLLKQMQEGAPVDVFASADQATMDKAVAAKVVDSATRKDFALNALVLIVPVNGKKPVDMAGLGKFSRIAVGNPESVPAGRYARDALTSAGLWETLQSKLILGESVRQVLDYVARGEVDAGFVYATDALKQAGKVDVVMTVSGHQPVLYPIAVALTGKNPKMGKAFLGYVLSPEGQTILGKYGFSKP